MKANAPLQADTLKDLKEHASTFIKLDLAYLAGAAALFTAFKLSTDELPAISKSFWAIAAAYYVVCAIDVLIFSMVFVDWIKCKTEDSTRLPTWTITYSTAHQAALHLMFLGCIGAAGMGMLHGIQEAREDWEGQVMLQEEVEAHILKNGRVPAAITELKSNYNLTKAMEKLKNQPVAIAPDALEGYKLTFSGRDGRFSTEDDFSVTHAISLRRGWEKARSAGR